MAHTYYVRVHHVLHRGRLRGYDLHRGRLRGYDLPLVNLHIPVGSPLLAVETLHTAAAGFGYWLPGVPACFCV